MKKHLVIQTEICYNALMRALLVFGFIALYVGLAFVPPSEANIHALAKQAQSLTDTDVSTLVETAQNGLHAAIPLADSAIKKATELVSNPTRINASLSGLVTFGASSAMKAQLERIQWAAAKGDPKLCKNLGELMMNTTDTAGTPSFGDYLAFCLAAVTKEISRCDQISTETAPSLYSACQKALDDRG